MGYYMAGDYYAAGGFFSFVKKAAQAVVKVAYANPITKAVSQLAQPIGKAVGGPWGAAISAAGALNSRAVQALEPHRAPAGMPDPGSQALAPMLTEATYNSAPTVNPDPRFGVYQPHAIAARPLGFAGRTRRGRVTRRRLRRRY